MTVAAARPRVQEGGADRQILPGAQVPVGAIRASGD